MAFNFLGSPGYAGGVFGGRGGAGTNVFGELDPKTVALLAMADKFAEAGRPQPYKTSTLGVLGVAACQHKRLCSQTSAFSARII
jgi:hypothetical protein